MRWPFWLPYPGAYAHCLLMLGLSSLNAAILSPVVWVIFVVGGAASIAVEAFAGSATLSALLVFGVVLAIGTLSLLLLAYEYQLLHCFRRWVREGRAQVKVYAIPPAEYWRDAVFGYLAFGSCTLVIFLSWTVWRCYAGYCQAQLTREEACIIGVSSLMLMIFCYHLRLLHQEWLERRRRRKQGRRKPQNPATPPKSQPTKPPATSTSPNTSASQPRPLSVEEELELLKQRMGKGKKNSP
ncbi:MAG: hypothetical protein AAGG51_11715 [Cyanobacteria bacterium P01_G01_bin.54]